MSSYLGGMHYRQIIESSKTNKFESSKTNMQPACPNNGFLQKYGDTENPNNIIGTNHAAYQLSFNREYLTITKATTFLSVFVIGDDGLRKMTAICSFIHPISKYNNRRFSDNAYRCDYMGKIVPIHHVHEGHYSLNLDITY